MHAFASSFLNSPAFTLIGYGLPMMASKQLEQSSCKIVRFYSGVFEHANAMLTAGAIAF